MDTSSVKPTNAKRTPTATPQKDLAEEHGEIRGRPLIFRPSATISEHARLMRDRPAWRTLESCGAAEAQ
eukprot:2924596-Alexandrium_andersonii.AAC.1